MSTVRRKLSAGQLLDLAGESPNDECHCFIKRCIGWESFGFHQVSEEQLELVGTLRDLNDAEPTVTELHPNGTSYGSDKAPVAPDFFPYNRCDVYRCKDCKSNVLRYTEFGGYFVDHRIRLLNGAPVIT